MKFLGTLLFYFLCCVANASAGEVPYHNPEYRFAISLIGNERLCQGDMHGIAISVGTEGCAGNKEYRPVTIYVEYNANFERQFPTKAMYESCTNTPAKKIDATLGKHAWYVCEVQHRGAVNVFYYNVVKANPIVKWRFFTIEATMSAEKYRAHEMEILSIVHRLHLVRD